MRTFSGSGFGIASCETINPSDGETQDKGLSPVELPCDGVGAPIEQGSFPQFNIHETYLSYYTDVLGIW